MLSIRRKRISILFYAMVAPTALLFFLLHTLPFLQGIFYSFTDWKGYGTWDFVGFKNYTQMFRDPKILQAYLFTFKLTISATLLVNVLSLMIACGLNANIKLKNFLKTVYFLPYMLGTLIISYVFKYIFSNVLPAWGRAFGIPGISINILGTENAWLGVLLVTVWQSLAFNTMIYLSGLQSIEKDIYEAAEMDGAIGLKRLWTITIPLIAPFFTINMVLCGRNYLMAFDQVIALTNGGPGTLTQTISVLIYKRGFNGGQFAYQSANAVIFFVVVITISILQLLVLERKEKKYD